MGDYTHDPLVNFSANWLKEIGGQQYGLGRDTTSKGMDTLAPAGEYFKRLLGGDSNEAMKAIQPQADAIGQQFQNVRDMISTQPRGGGKTSELARLPVEQIRILSNLISGARGGAAQGLESIGSKYLDTGQQQIGRSLQANQGAGQLALQGRGQDMGKKSWGDVFKDTAAAGIKDVLGVLI